MQTIFSLSETSKVLYGKLTVESAVRDDRGKNIANSTTARYVGRDRFVGLKKTSWVLTAGQEAKVLLLVVDEHGNPVADTEQAIKIQETLKTLYSGVEGEYYAGDEAWEYLAQISGYDLKSILIEIAEKKDNES